jgi:hypothetical protein
MARRRFVVKEVVDTKPWSGAVSAVGCKTEEVTDAAFRLRVVQNMLNGDPGGVIANDRRQRRAIRSTTTVSDSRAAANGGGGGEVRRRHHVGLTPSAILAEQ